MNIRKRMFKKSHLKTSLKKYLGINLTNLVKDLYTKKYKKMIKLKMIEMERYPIPLN